MLGFIKKLFSVQQLSQEELSLAQLSKWFDDRTNQYFEDTKNLIREKYNELTQQYRELEEGIEALDKAEIKDAEKIEHRVKNIVIGHRDNYIKQINLLVRSSEVPNDINYESANDFTVMLSENLDHFGKNTMKSYSATQHLFFNETEVIRKIIKNISTLSKELSESLKDSKITKIHKVKEDIKELSYKKELKEKLEVDMRQLLEELKAKEEELKKKQEELKAIEGSDDHKIYLSFLQEKENVEKDIKNIKNNTLQLFMPLERGFRKLRKITVMNEKVIDSYLNDAVMSLQNDKELKILEVLENLKKNISAGSVELKDGEKIIGKIAELSEDRIKNILSELDKARQKKEKLEQDITQSKVAADKRGCNEAVTEIEYNIKKLNNEIEDIKKKADFDAEKMKKKLVEDIRDAINVDVILNDK